MELGKLKSVRTGHRGAATKILRKISEGCNFDEATLEEYVRTLTEKRNLLKKLDDQILNAMTEDEDIGTEIDDSDEYMINLNLKIKEHSNALTKNSNTMGRERPTFTRALNQSLNANAPDYIPLSNNNHKLPKLDLLTFLGNLLDWQTFWDCFESSILNKVCLSNVDKFSYLRSLLRGEALQAVSGFTLTNTNYGQAIDVLVERYGQNHKIVNAHMQNLVELPAPRDIVNLRSYLDKTKTYIRSLESLGTHAESYSALLVPIILRKLPRAFLKDITRQNGSDHWDLHSLLGSIKQEICIRDSTNFGIEREPDTTTTATFLTNGNNSNRTSRKSTNSSVSTKQAKFDINSRPSTPTASHILLKTAVAEVQSTNGTGCDANIMFDEGSQRSFVTRQMADQLAMKTIGTEVLNLSGFGSTNGEISNLDKVRLLVIVVNNQRIPIEAKGIKISSQLQRILRSEERFTEERLAGLKKDCSCKESKGSPSLNDCLGTNAPQLNNLKTLLTNFRMNKYAVTADIEKAFLQVGLDEEDRDYTRFFWLKDYTYPKSEIVSYRFKVVLFGATCSPFLLNATLLKLFQDNESTTATTLKQSLYVDNVLNSFTDENTLLSFYQESRNLLQKGGFNLRSWNSDSTQLTDQAQSDRVEDSTKDVKILGMRWNVDSNTLGYPCLQLTPPDKLTKREIPRKTTRAWNRVEIHPKESPLVWRVLGTFIGIVKTTIFKVIGSAYITIEELSTLISEVEMIINDRPITHVSVDNRDPEPLTPSHLLYGRRISSPVYPDERQTPHEPVSHVILNNQYSRETEILQHIWTRWKKEYLTSLREFQRASGTVQETIKIGDVVQIHDDTKRIYWKLGVVEDLIIGGDGHARAATVRTRSGRSNRPITKLFPLEININEPRRSERLTKS
ncbi:uncharacterized protein [Argopecten irradians]|uniref:uncharacterized protein n=1 Tax=Argopecten irradians TaxID=31199 RepID=UPI00371757DC